MHGVPPLSIAWDKLDTSSKRNYGPLLGPNLTGHPLKKDAAIRDSLDSAEGRKFSGRGDIGSSASTEIVSKKKMC